MPRASEVKLLECIPELRPMLGFEQHSRYHKYDVWNHSLEVISAIKTAPILRWTALFHDISKPHCLTLDGEGEGHFYGHAGKSAEMADAIMRRLGFDDAEREHIFLLVKHHDTPLSTEPERVRRLVNRFGAELALELVEMHRADTAGQAECCAYRYTEFDAVEAEINKVMEEKSRFSLKDLAINGNDLIALGLEGKTIGETLQACLEAVLSGENVNEKEALLDKVKSLDLV